MFTRNDAVAILGAGHGGLALAGYLAQRGHHVALWNRSPERVAPVAQLGGIQLGGIQLGGIQLGGSGAVATLAPIALATSNLAETLAGVRRVLVTVPASGHADVARRCAPHLRDGQTVLLLPGRTGGALEFRRILRTAGCRANVLLGEASTFPLAARTVAPASAVVFGAKADVQAAALPASRTGALVAAWRPLLPMLSPARSVLHTGFANVGALLHPIIALLNADRIKGGDAFDFYTDGVTPRVAAVLAAADAERLRIARAYGVGVASLQAWVAAAYGHCADTVLAAVGGNPAYVGIKAPNTLEHRYLLEDVPTGLIPLIELGAAAGVAAPTLRSLVDLARVVLGGERWRGARTLRALGLDGLGVEGIRAAIERGFTPATPAAAPVEASRFGRFTSGLELLPQV